MRLPDPIANTTTEAYLAYKAGVLNVGDLKPSLYDPYLHYDAWLAYWAGLTGNYPVKNVGKNLFNKNNASQLATGRYINTSASRIDLENGTALAFIPCQPNTTYTVSKIVSSRFIVGTTSELPAAGVAVSGTKIDYDKSSITILTPSSANYLVVYFYRSASDTATIQELLDSLQIEKGSTATPYEPYTGTPEMLTDEEALVAYLAGVTNTYPEEYSDPIDARITGYLRYLVSVRFGRPDYPVNNIEFYLSLMKPPIVTNDTPSANIELDHTVEAAFVDVKMYGDTSQQTYTGKNLFGATLAQLKSINTAGSWGTDNAYTYRGVKYTPVFQGSCLVRVDLSGTATANSNFLLSEVAASDLSKIITVGDTYILSGCPAGGSPTTYYLRVQERPYKQLYTDVGSGFSGAFPTLSTGATALLQTIGVDSGADVNGKKYYPQFEAGSSATSFEPYVGGVPSPNPDYPQPVQTVTGEQTVTVRRKNLLKSPYNMGTSYTSHGITATVNADGSVTLNGTHDGGGTATFSFEPGWDYNYAPIILPAGTYTWSLKDANGNQVTRPRFRSELYKSDGTYIYAIAAQTVTTTEETHANGRLLCYAGESYNNLTVYPQIELGSTATSFVPYQEQSYEVNLGKNLTQGEFRQGTYNNASDLRRITTQHGVFLPAGTTATISFELDTATYRTVVTGLTVDGVTDDIFYNSGWFNEKSFTFAAPQSGYYFLTVAYRQETSESRLLPTSGVVSNLQFELGSTATSYAPYFTPIELCKLGDYQDYIYKDGQQWYIRRMVGRLVPTGSEPWYLSGRAIKCTWANLGGGISNISRNYKNDSGDLGEVAYTPIATQTYFTYFQPSSATGQGFALMTARQPLSDTTNALYFYYPNVLDTVAKVKAYFAANPTTIYYVLQDTVNEEITNSALIGQLETLLDGGSYNGKTYITVTAAGNNLPGLLKVEAGTE